MESSQLVYLGLNHLALNTFRSLPSPSPLCAHLHRGSGKWACDLMLTLMSGWSGPGVGTGYHPLGCCGSGLASGSSAVISYGSLGLW